MQQIFAANAVLLNLNILIFRCRFVSKEKGIEFINNVHLRDGCRHSTVSFLLINLFVKLEKI